MLATEVAEIFNVSSESAKIRIKQLGFDFAKSPVKQKTLLQLVIRVVLSHCKHKHLERVLLL